MGQYLHQNMTLDCYIVTVLQTTLFKEQIEGIQDMMCVQEQVEDHFWMLLYSAVPLMRVLCAQVFWLHKAFCRHKKPTVLAPPSHMCPADDQDDDDDGDDDGTSIFCRSALTKL